MTPWLMLGCSHTMPCQRRRGKRKEDGTLQEEKLPVDCSAMLTMASYGVVGSDFSRNDFWCIFQGNAHPPGWRRGSSQCFYPPWASREHRMAGERCFRLIPHSLQQLSHCPADPPLLHTNEPLAGSCFEPAQDVRQRQ